MRLSGRVQRPTGVAATLHRRGGVQTNSHTDVLSLLRLHRSGRWQLHLLRGNQLGRCLHLDVYLPCCRECVLRETTLQSLLLARSFAGAVLTRNSLHLGHVFLSSASLLALAHAKCLSVLLAALFLAIRVQMDATACASSVTSAHVPDVRPSEAQ